MTDALAALIGLGVVLTGMTLMWVLSVRLRNASIADIFWGQGFVMLAWMYCALTGAQTPRSWLVASLITV